MRAFWKRHVEDPDAFPPEFSGLFLHSGLTALGGKMSFVCVRFNDAAHAGDWSGQAVAA